MFKDRNKKIYPDVNLLKSYFYAKKKPVYIGIRLVKNTGNKQKQKLLT